MSDEKRINYSYKNEKGGVSVTLGLRNYFGPIEAIHFTIDVDGKHYTFNWEDGYMICVYALCNNKKLYKKYIENKGIFNAIEYTIKEYHKYIKEH